MIESPCVWARAGTWGPNPGKETDENAKPGKEMGSSLSEAVQAFRGVGALEGEEVAATGSWQEVAAAPGTATSLDQDGGCSSRRRGARAVDELALATLGYLVLPIKSPGLKNETNSLPCPCPRVFYVSELCPFCCQITFAPLALKSCWRHDLPCRPYGNAGCVKHVEVAGTEGGWVHGGGETGLKGTNRLSLTPGEKPPMRLCLKATGRQLKAVIHTGSESGRPGTEHGFCHLAAV